MVNLRLWGGVGALQLSHEGHNKLGMELLRVTGQVKAGDGRKKCWGQTDGEQNTRKYPLRRRDPFSQLWGQ